MVMRRLFVRIIHSHDHARTCETARWLAISNCKSHLENYWPLHPQLLEMLTPWGLTLPASISGGGWTMPHHRTFPEKP